MASSTTWVLVESPQSESGIVPSQKALRREPRMDAKSCSSSIGLLTAY
jgi:hypothetical protein